MQITVEEIVLIHDRIVQETGGSLGLREPGMLESAARKPFVTYGSDDLYPDIFLKTAALFEALVNYHVFVDGNKRCAIAVLEYFLAKNGCAMRASKQQKEDFTLNTATQNPDLADVALWIKQHSKKLQ